MATPAYPLGIKQNPDIMAVARAPDVGDHSGLISTPHWHCYSRLTCNLLIEIDKTIVCKQCN